MPREIKVGGKVHHFPDEATDEEISVALQADEPKVAPSFVDKGVGFVKDSLSDAYKSGGEAVSAGGQLMSNVAGGKVFTDENAGLAADTLGKGFAAALPLLPLAVGAGIATAGIVPTTVGMLAGAGAGYLGMKAGKGMAQAVGASPNMQRLAGEVGGLVGGGGVSIKSAQKMAQRLAGSSQNTTRAANPVVQKAAQYVAQRLDDVDKILRPKRKMFESNPDRLSATEQMKGAFVEDTLPATGRLRADMKKSGATKEQIHEFMADVDNDLARGRRPDTDQVRIIEGTNFEQELRNLANKRVGNVSGLQQADRYFSALKENEHVLHNPKMLTQLPGVGGSARVAENFEIIKAFEVEMIPLKREMDKIILKGIVEPAVEMGLLSEGAAKRLQTFDDYIKEGRPLSDIEAEALAGRGGAQRKPALGIGDSDPLPFLKSIERRESKPVIQATLDQMQMVNRDGAKNQTLQRIANESAQWDAKTGTIKPGRFFPDMLVVPGGVTDKIYKSLPDQIKSTTGTSRVMIGGKEHTLMGAPATMNAFNSFDQVSADAAIKMWPWVRSVSGIANRGFKMATTGVFAPIRKGVNAVYNLAQVYQQLPLSASTAAVLRGARYGMEFLAKELSPLGAVVGASRYKGSKQFQRIRDEGLKTASFGTSTEIIRGVGEKNIGLIAAKGSPEELFRYVVWDPAKEMGNAITGKPFDRQVVKQIGALAEDSLRYFEDASNFDEVGLRMGVYDTMQRHYAKQGKSAEVAKSLASWDARNIITDFTRRGTFARNFELLGMPFAQAAITGMRTNAMYAYQNPMQFAAHTSAAVAAHAWLTHMNRSDPAKARILDDISVEDQARKMFFINPDKIRKNEKNQYIDGIVAIPFLESPFARAAAAGIIQIANQQTPLQNASTSLVLWNMVRKGGAQFLPIDPDPIAIASSMPVVGPLAQIYRNQDTFTKGPIVSPRNIRRTPEWIRGPIEGMGGSKELAAQAHFLAKKLLPSVGRIDDSPQDGGEDVGLLSEYWRQFKSPLFTQSGGAIKRRAKER